MPAPIPVLVVSYGRPFHLWACLDALYRKTQGAARIVLVDNWHPDRTVDLVIDAFVRRGLFAEVHRFETNSVGNILAVYEPLLRDAGPVHVYMESDAVVAPVDDRCWLAEMARIFAANPGIGMLGSVVDTDDFVAEETLARPEFAGLDVSFLAKLRSPERAFVQERAWQSPDRDFFHTEPPCPVPNPPGRLLMLSTPAMREIGLHRDSQLAREFRSRGYRPAMTARVRHRHLSLLNLFDYPQHAATERNDFFTTFRPKPKR